MSNDDIVLGIDLGTTNSAACIFKDGEFEIIPSALGNDSFPSVVAVSKNGELLVGQFAQKQMLTNPENTVANVKLKMGTNELIRFNGEDLRPQEISAHILANIKRDAESYLSRPIDKAIISVPTSFDDDARNATIEAGQIAGFEVETIVNEPTAACLAYATIKDIRGNILVFDIGGGTLDITIGSFDGDELVPQSTVGYRVGGRNITRALFDYVQNEFEEINGLKLEDYVTPDYDPLVALYDAVETAKIELSSTKTTKIYIPSIVVTDEGERINLDMEVHRSKLNELSDFVIERSEQGIADALSGANLTKEDIDYLVFVGGPTKMPLLKESIEKTLGMSAAEGIDPMLSVAQGASIFVGGPVDVPFEINSLNLGLVLDEHSTRILIPRNTQIPAEETILVTTKYPDQTRVEIKLVEGDSSIAEENNSVKSFILEGIPKGPAGKAKIEVKLKINKNGTMQLSAREFESNARKSVFIKSDVRMSREEIEKAGGKINALRKKGDERKEILDILNDAEEATFRADSFIRKYEEKILPSDLDELNKNINEIEKLLEDSEEEDFDDFDLIEFKTKELQKLLDEIEDYIKSN